jgi:RNA polymerase sigma factor (sigma-70 family)
MNENCADDCTSASTHFVAALQSEAVHPATFRNERRSRYVTARSYSSTRSACHGIAMNEQTKNRFFELLRPLQDRLVWYIYVLSRDEEEARDIVGDAILLAYDHFDTLRSETAFELFLFRIARREYFRVRRRMMLFTRLKPEHECIGSEAMRALETGVDAQLVLNCICRMPQRQRETVTLYEIAGFSLEEIRGLQGGSLSGVKSRLVRARKKLEKHFDYRFMQSENERAETLALKVEP